MVSYPIVWWYAGFRDADVHPNHGAGASHETQARPYRSHQRHCVLCENGGQRRRFKHTARLKFTFYSLNLNYKITRHFIINRRFLIKCACFIELSSQFVVVYKFLPVVTSIYRTLDRNVLIQQVIINAISKHVSFLLIAISIKRVSRWSLKLHLNILCLIILLQA